MIKLSSIKKEQSQPKNLYIDLNSDLGEGFGIYENNREKEIMAYVSSVNIPCGGHAGDPKKISEALKLAKMHTLSIGAHIGYPDTAGFGYREMNLTYDELQALVLFQVGAIKSMALAYSLCVDYVRPHGALYKQMAKDAALAITVAKALEFIDPWLILVGPVGDSLNNVKAETKIRIAPEIQLDKQYDDNGCILFDQAPITDVDQCVLKATRLIKENKLVSNNGNLLDVDFKTLHLSSSSENAVKIAEEVRALFTEKPIPVSITLVGDNALY